MIVCVDTDLWFGLSLSMQHPFGARTRNCRFILLRKFRGQQSAGPAGDGEAQSSLVVSANCLMNLNAHLLRPAVVGPLCFSFMRFTATVVL